MIAAAPVRGAPLVVWRDPEPQAALRVLEEEDELELEDDAADDQEEPKPHPFLGQSVLEILRTHGPVTMGQLREAFPGEAWSRVLPFLRTKQVQMRGRHDAAIVALPGALAPVVELDSRRRLPVLEAGAGDRRNDCDHYSGCIDRLSRLPSTKTTTEGRCPAGCSSYAREAVALERLHMAASRPGSFDA